MLLTICTIGCAFAASGERIPVKYLKTSDGDTMRVMLDGENTRVRFLGINTPEVSGEDKIEEPWGNEALAFTREKLDKAKKIEIEYDDVADHEDRFGRKLAWIWVDDELFEVKLLEEGLAKTYMLKNNYRYANELKAAERKAKQAKIGVWSDEKPSLEKQEETSITETAPEKEGTSSREQPEPIFVEESTGEGISLSSFLIATLMILIIVVLTKKKNKKNRP